MGNPPRHLQSPAMRERIRLENLRWRDGHYQRLRLRIFRHYGGEHFRCARCGEDNEWFLTLDHVNNDGYRHRKSLGANPGTYDLYRWIVKNNYPPIFQILCMNCNLAKKLRKGVCPHQASIRDLSPRFRILNRHPKV